MRSDGRYQQHAQRAWRMREGALDWIYGTWYVPTFNPLLDLESLARQTTANAATAVADAQRSGNEILVYSARRLLAAAKTFEIAVGEARRQHELG